LTREARVTIPLTGEAARPVNPAVRLRERAAAQGRELPLSKPLSRQAERVLIAVIAAVVVAGTVLAFVMDRPSHTGVGWLVGGVGGAVLGALIWAHLSGGIDQMGRAPRAAAAEPATATVAPAQDPSVLPTTYRLAPVRARAVAGLLDQALALLPLLLLVILRDQRLVQEQVSSGLVVLALALFLLAAPLSLWLTNGRTLGRKLLGIRVVCADGARMTLRRVLRRELGGAARAGLLEGVLSIASMGTDELRRSRADARGRTVVVFDDV
jgi:uncharacterized RDD family membrane protein YckC